MDAIAPGDRAIWARLLTPAISRYEVKVHGNVALVAHEDDERETYHGIPLQANYLMTETWLKQGANWRLAMVHVYVVAKDPPAMAVPGQSLKEYEGRYRAAADLAYGIRRAGDHLVGEREGRPSATLVEEAPDVFFVPGEPRSRKIFRRDAQNKIVDFVDRREREDLVFVRQQP